MMREFMEHEKLSSIIFEEADVSFYINKLKTTKSPGPDNIYPIELKELRDVIVKPLTHVFNESVRNSVVPEDFKLANVAPIFKKR